MPKSPNTATGRPVLVYARKQNGPRLYIGATITEGAEDPDALRARLLSTQIGNWFEELDIIVQSPHR